jgi:hypothetical protein
MKRKVSRSLQYVPYLCWVLSADLHGYMQRAVLAQPGAADHIVYKPDASIKQVAVCGFCRIC